MKVSRILFSSIGVIIILTISILFSYNNAHGVEQQLNKKYITIQIQREDTLWSISNTYMNTDIHTIQNYIAEIKIINNLPNDKIYAGENIIIPIVN